MLARYAFGLAAFAAVMTLAWLFIDERRVTFTSGIAFASWAYLALTGGDLTVLTNSGTKKAAALPDEFRLLLALFAVLSALAFILYRIGLYPPASEEPVDAELPEKRGFRGD